MSMFTLSAFTTIAPLSDRFISLSVEGTLMIKVCGFVEDHHAKILDVSKEMLRLRIGHSWLERSLMQVEQKKPLEVLLIMRALTDEEQDLVSYRSLPISSFRMIEVTIRPGSPGWSHEEFQKESRELLRSIRYHFMAC